jgi:hypothetical protein
VDSTDLRLHSLDSSGNRSSYVLTAAAPTANQWVDYIQATGVPHTSQIGSLNGTLLSGLATGLLKNTTGTGVPSIGVANTDYLPVASPAFTGTMAGVNETLSGNLTVSGTCTGCASGGGAVLASQLGDFAVVRTSATLLTVGAGCSSTTPCNTLFGYSVVGITSSHTVTLVSGAGTILGYVTNAGVMTVGYPSGGVMSITCSGCTAVSGVTSFPPGSSPKYSYAAAANTWTALSGVDYRAFESGPPNYLAGTGLIITQTPSSITFAADYSVTAPLASPTFTGQMGAPLIAFASLGTVPAAGKFVYCTNCTTAATCAGSGTGHMAVSNGSQWTCQ